jgi:cation transport protein ChaC
MLTRHAITSGAYLESFHKECAAIWSAERIRQSLEATLAARPEQESGDIWVFAYGSLIWNPLLDYAERRPATLGGWHRSFCLRMVAGRGSADMPGRMLALEPGGSTQGMAFRLDATKAMAELRVMWVREMVAGSYRPIWARIALAGGGSAMAIVFVADTEQPQYRADSSVGAIAGMVGTASGTFGGNADYVFQLELALRELGAEDAYIASLADELRIRAAR